MQIYALIRGGLGNQMFQYAHAFSLASKYRAKLSLVDGTQQSRFQRTWALDCFGIQPDDSCIVTGTMAKGLDAFLRQLDKWHSLNKIGVLIEREGQISESSGMRPYWVSGYWQSERYFAPYANEVRSVFSFPDPTVEEFSIGDDPVAAIHFRRGDYVSDQLARDKHLTCDENWYRYAWAHIRSSVPNVSAAVFSDEPDTAKQLLKLEGNVRYVDTPRDAAPWRDMAAMSRCSHFIISNSTYSWWAAYLNEDPNKIVVAPKWWFRGVSTQSLGLCQTGWEIL